MQKYWKISSCDALPESDKKLWKELLQKGAVFIYPTETIYGIGTAPFKKEWVKNIYSIKGRSDKNPLPLIASTFDDAKKAFSEWNETAEKLARSFWPGPLTIVLKANPLLPEILHSGTGKIAVRVSSNPIARLLAELAGGLIISTSANRSGEPPAKVPRLIHKDIFERVDAIIDTGPLEGKPSTVVDCSGGDIKIIREGAVDKSKICEVLKRRL